jgi:hypothetical protein
MTAEQRIARLKSKLVELGPMLPGSISEQWNICGTAGCACKDPKNPKKHGPYYQLSFSVKGRSSTMFLKKSAVTEARRRIRRYQEFKKLCFELVEANVSAARQTGLQGRQA